MNHISNDINDAPTLQLIAAAVQHLKAEGVAASITPLPGIGYVAVGTPADVARLLEIAPAQAAQPGAVDLDKLATYEPMIDTAHGGVEVAGMEYSEDGEYYKVDDVRNLIAQAREARPAGAAPEGYVLVPKKITPEMIEAAIKAHYGKHRVAQVGGAQGVAMTVNSVDYNGVHAMRRFWSGALAAAPTPQPQAAQPVSSPAQSAEAEPVAWMNPETLDVIHDTRKRAWENDFGMGGKSKAAGYTYPLAAPAPQEVKQSDKAVAANADGLPTAAWLIEWETATGDKRHMVAMHNFAGDVRAEHGNATATELVRRTAAADAGEPPADPMDWPIPCDVKVGGVTIKEGCKLRTLVTRMESLQRMAVAGLPKVTQEERDAFFKQFPHLAPADRAAAQGAADQDPRTTTKG